MKLVDSTPFLLDPLSVNQIPCFVLQLPLQEDTKSLQLQRQLQLLQVVQVVVHQEVKGRVVPLHLGRCRVRLVQQVDIHTHTQACPILDIHNMDNHLVILRGCHNRHMVGQGSPCLHFLPEELGEVIQTHHREEEELRLELQAVLLLPLVVHLERLQEHQVLQVKCLVVCPDILVILTPLCTLTCIGNKHSTWAHRTDNSNNNHFTHQVMLPEVLVKEDLEGLPVLTLPNSQVPPQERQVLQLRRERQMIRMLDQKRRRSLPLKRVREKHQKKKRMRRRRIPKNQKRLRVHRNHFHSKRVIELTNHPGFISSHKTTFCSVSS
mmetsp:Transcript_36049/g.52930  ORF Transcript_36049/g.52930 Transcript_36049/m.52930 type:complete len:322 (+) Transcript_36049:678-1643(+)